LEKPEGLSDIDSINDNDIKSLHNRTRFNSKLNDSALEMESAMQNGSIMSNFNVDPNSNNPEKMMEMFT
jgi:hypothetical protein